MGRKSNAQKAKEAKKAARLAKREEKIIEELVIKEQVDEESGEVKEEELEEILKEAEEVIPLDEESKEVLDIIISQEEELSGTDLEAVKKEKQRSFEGIEDNSKEVVLDNGEEAYQCTIKGGIIFSRTCINENDIIILKMSDNRNISNELRKSKFVKEVNEEDIKDNRIYRF